MACVRARSWPARGVTARLPARDVTACLRARAHLNTVQTRPAGCHRCSVRMYTVQFSNLPCTVD
jgi:hypothetical protein